MFGVMHSTIFNYTQVLHEKDNEINRLAEDYENKDDECVSIQVQLDAANDELRTTRELFDEMKAQHQEMKVQHQEMVTQYREMKSQYTRSSDQHARWHALYNEAEGRYQHTVIRLNREIDTHRLARDQLRETLTAACNTAEAYAETFAEMLFEDNPLPWYCGGMAIDFTDADKGKSCSVCQDEFENTEQAVKTGAVRCRECSTFHHAKCLLTFFYKNKSKAGEWPACRQPGFEWRIPIKQPAPIVHEDIYTPPDTVAPASNGPDSPSYGPDSPNYEPISPANVVDPPQDAPDMPSYRPPMSPVNLDD